MNKIGEIINLNEAITVKNIYTYIKNNSSQTNPLTEAQIKKKFKLTNEEFRHLFNLMISKYNLPLRYDFRDTIKDKEFGKTLCHFCKEVHGTFRIMEKNINPKGSRVSGLFVCDKCYNNMIK